MGHLKTRIDHLAASLFKRYCLGHPRYVNRRAVLDDLSNTMLNYLVSSYTGPRRDEYFEILIAKKNIKQLTDQLRETLMIVRGDRCSIEDVIGLTQQYLNHNPETPIESELKEFIVSNETMIWRNLRPLMKKKSKLQKWLQKKNPNALVLDSGDGESWSSDDASLDNDLLEKIDSGELVVDVQITL